MSDQHSLGPWSGPYRLVRGWKVYDQGGTVIGAVAREADARLISAAPDLLHAARLGRAIIAAERKVVFDSNVVPSTGKLHGADAVSLVDSYDRALLQLDAAILKAEVGS